MVRRGLTGFAEAGTLAGRASSRLKTGRVQTLLTSTGFDAGAGVAWLKEAEPVRR
jgi:hypothetical protein